jgi:hypothetical protein
MGYFAKDQMIVGADGIRFPHVEAFDCQSFKGELIPQIIFV